MKTEFEKKLTELGFSYQCYPVDFYLICQNNDGARNINAQLIKSEPIDKVIRGSRNNNKIQAFGVFKFRIPPTENETDLIIFAFQNTRNHSIEFIIIPYKELKRRLIVRNRILNVNEGIEIVFWLMDDDNNNKELYDCTSVGIEWEWYYLSKGVNGRMADGTEWDYSEFLNDWDKLKIV